MEVVHQAQPLSMGWCLNCHRNPEPHLRPKDVAPTKMDFVREPVTGGKSLMAEYGIHDAAYMQSCYTCHR
jgi:hypothetical protein